MEKRFPALYRVLFSLWVALALRMVYISILAPSRYTKQVQGYTSRFSLPPRRGDFLDRRGRPWVTNTVTLSLVADPRAVDSPQETSSLVASLLGGSPERYRKSLQEKLVDEVLLLSNPTPQERRILAPLQERGWVVVRKVEGHPFFQLTAVPSQVEDAPQVAEVLAPFLGTPPFEILRRLETSAPQVVLGSLSEVHAKELQGLNLPGLRVEAVSPSPEEKVFLRPKAPGALLPTGKGARFHPHLEEALRQLHLLRPTFSIEDVEQTMWRRYVLLARDVPTPVAQSLEALRRLKGNDEGNKRLRQRVQGLSIQQHTVRSYPYGPLGRDWFGRTDPNGQGLSGWEKMFNASLQGLQGQVYSVVDLRGKPLPQFLPRRKEAQHGYHVQLTLDLYLQNEAEALLKRVVQGTQADWASLVLCDPYEGAILAMATVSGPQDPTKSLGATKPATLAFEPGSVFKPLVVAAALEEGLVTPRTLLRCGGRYPVAGRYLHCAAWDSGLGQHGTLTVAEAVRSSCNVALIQIAQRLGEDRLKKWFHRFGLFEASGVWDSEREARGFVYPDLLTLKGPRWSATKVATVAYGQGIQVTMLGLLRAYCALVNGGKLPQLHVWQSTLSEEGERVHRFPSLPQSSLLSPSTSRHIVEMLLLAVEDPQGTGRRARSPLYTIAGKTGTALHYRSWKRTVSFAGMAPYPRPRLLALATVSGARLPRPTGGLLCAPIVREMLERALIYLGVPPDREFSEEEERRVQISWWEGRGLGE